MDEIENNINSDYIYWELIGDQFGAKLDIQGVGKYSARQQKSTSAILVLNHNI